MSWYYPIMPSNSQTQQFNAPGTWTKPTTATQVEVLVVGGGGGGGGGNPTPQFWYGGGGGGGRVIHRIVPVSAPVPITVGSGGAGGIYPPTGTNTSAGVGGTSAFGPLGPGPIPLIPASTIAAGGGAAGATYNAPADPTNINAPSIGGGGGGRGWGPIFGLSASGNGSYGSPGRTQFRTDSGPSTSYAGSGGGGADASAGLETADGGSGLFGFGGGGGGAGMALASQTGSQAWYIDGGGGGAWASTILTAPPSFLEGAMPGKANTGGGGGGGYTPNPATWPGTGGAGGSGVVIVRWIE